MNFFAKKEPVSRHADSAGVDTPDVRHAFGLFSGRVKVQVDLFLKSHMRDAQAVRLVSPAGLALFSEELARLKHELKGDISLITVFVTGRHRFEFEVLREWRDSDTAIPCGVVVTTKDPYIWQAVASLATKQRPYRFVVNVGLKYEGVETLFSELYYRGFTQYFKWYGKGLASFIDDMAVPIKPASERRFDLNR